MTRSGLVEIVVVVVALLLGYGGIGYAQRGEAARPVIPSPRRIEQPTATVAAAMTFTPVPTATPVPATSTATSTPVLTPTATPSATRQPTKTRTPTPTPIVYVVQAGDSLDSVASQFGVSADAIARANQLSDPDSLAEGQKLIIPRK